MNERPSDEITGKVVAKQYGFSGAKGPFWRGWNAFQSIEAPYTIVKDPRYDTDAALELLHWLMWDRDDSALSINPRRNEWEVYCNDTDMPYDRPPISGQPFRYAVVAFAARVLKGADE